MPEPTEPTVETPIEGAAVTEIARDIAARLDSLDARFSDEEMKTAVESQLAALLEDGDSDVVRKLTHGQGDKRLVGSKYARAGLSASDI